MRAHFDSSSQLPPLSAGALPAVDQVRALPSGADQSPVMAWRSSVETGVHNNSHETNYPQQFMGTKGRELLFQKLVDMRSVYVVEGDDIFILATKKSISSLYPDGLPSLNASGISPGLPGASGAIPGVSVAIPGVSGAIPGASGAIPSASGAIILNGEPLSDINGTAVYYDYIKLLTNETDEKDINRLGEIALANLNKKRQEQNQKDEDQRVRDSKQSEQNAKQASESVFARLLILLEKLEKGLGGFEALNSKIEELYEAFLKVKTSDYTASVINFIIITTTIASLPLPPAPPQIKSLFLGTSLSMLWKNGTIKLEVLPKDILFGGLSDGYGSAIAVFLMYTTVIYPLQPLFFATFRLVCGSVTKGSILLFKGLEGLFLVTGEKDGKIQTVDEKGKIQEIQKETPCFPICIKNVKLDGFDLIVEILRKVTLVDKLVNN